MTFSIVARSDHAYGVAVASRFLAVGAVVPAAEASVGALATQSYANVAYRPQGLALLRTGVAAPEVVAGLTAADPGRERRQLGVVSATGPGATYTGSECHDWAGGEAGDGWAIQGNLLTGPQVITAMRDVWLGGDTDAPLARRLVAALRAGDQAGGDRRGRQSAAVLVVAASQGYGQTSDTVVDLRVDDHPDPVGELARLLEVHTMLFGKPEPDSLRELVAPLDDEVRRLLSRVGHPVAEPTPAALDAALADWAGIENLEERIVPGKIDPLVLAHLRASAG
ncbi:MAG TPA: DUF1028 domain-containing protein [Natronosporangium sp.]